MKLISHITHIIKSKNLGQLNSPHLSNERPFLLSNKMILISNVIYVEMNLEFFFIKASLILNALKLMRKTFEVRKKCFIYQKL